VHTDGEASEVFGYPRKFDEVLGGGRGREGQLTALQFYFSRLWFWVVGMYGMHCIRHQFRNLQVNYIKIWLKVY